MTMTIAPYLQRIVAAQPYSPLLAIISPDKTESG
jgi:hypothetical protein